MKTLDQHKAKLKEIATYAFQHGSDAIGVEPFEKGPPNFWERETVALFITKANEGFKIAQKLLIEEIKYYQSFVRQYTLQLKEARRLRNKANEGEVAFKIKIVEQRLHTLSHIANGIAWQLINGQIHIARRLNIEEETSKFLDSSNIEHAIRVADKINENPNDFALISDLTSFVQIGDLLVLHRSNIAIMELKEGKVNDLISELFQSLEKKGENPDDEALKEKFDDNTFKQIKRVQRQKERAKQAIEVINTDKGIDPVSKTKITISTPDAPTEYYDKELYALYKDLELKFWSYTVVDDCVHIGMYRDEGLKMAPYIIEALLKNQTENYMVIDYLSITKNLSEPIFAKPFPLDFIIDILSGKVKIIIGLNLDMLIVLFNSQGLKTRWMTEKETSKGKQRAPRKGMFIINKRGIVATLSSGMDIIIYGGIISKILYDNIKPHNIGLSMLSMTPDMLE